MSETQRDVNIDELRQEASDVNRELPEAIKSGGEISQSEVAARIIEKQEQQYQENISTLTTRAEDNLKAELARRVIAESTAETTIPERNPFITSTEDWQKTHPDRAFASLGLKRFMKKEGLDKEQAQKALALVSFLKEKGTRNIYKELRVQATKRDETIAKMQEKGWKLLTRPEDDQGGFVKLSFVAKGKSRLSNYEIGHAVQFTKTFDDPIRAVGLLMNATDHTSDNIITFYAPENIAAGMQDERTMEVLETAEQTGVKTSFELGYGMGVNGQIGAEKVDSETAQRMREISDQLGNNTPIFAYPSLVNLARSEEGMDLFRHFIASNPDKKWPHIVGGLNDIVEKGLAPKVIEALQANMIIPGLLDVVGYSGSGTQKLEEYFASPDYIESQTNTEWREFSYLVKNFSEMNAGDIKTLYDNYDHALVIAVLEAAKEADIPRISGLYDLDWIFKSPASLKLMTDPRFIESTKQLFASGVRIDSITLSSESSLYAFYREPELLKRLRTPVVENILRNKEPGLSNDYSKTLPGYESGARALAEISEDTKLTTPLLALKGMKVSYYFGKDLPKKLEEISSNSELNEALANPQFIEYVAKFKDQISNSVSVDNIDKVFDLYQNPEIKDAIFETENVKFLSTVKSDVSYEKFVDLIPELLKVEQPTRDLYFRLKKTFDYRTWRQNPIENFGEIAAAVDNEQIEEIFKPERIEAYRQMDEFGFSLPNAIALLKHSSAMIAVTMRMYNDDRLKEFVEPNYQNTRYTFLETASKYESVLEDAASLTAKFVEKDILPIKSQYDFFQICDHLLANPNSTLLQDSKLNTLQAIKDKYHYTFDLYNLSELEVLREDIEQIYSQLEACKIKPESIFYNFSRTNELYDQIEDIRTFIQIAEGEGLEIAESMMAAVDPESLNVLLVNPKAACEKIKVLQKVRPEYALSFGHVPGALLNVMIQKDISEEYLAQVHQGEDSETTYSSTLTKLFLKLSGREIDDGYQFYSISSGANQLMSASLKFLCKANEKDLDWFIDLYKNGSLDNPQVVAMLTKQADRIFEIPIEKRTSYFNIVLRIADSPSQEIKKIESFILDQVFQADDPEKVYDVIEQIFIKNNLPMVGKVFKIFSALHPYETLTQQRINSPVLDRLRKRGLDSVREQESFMAVIFRDLIKCHFYSANRSLSQYLEAFTEGEGALDKLDNGIELTKEEQKQASYLLARLQTIFINSQLGERPDANKEFSGDPKEILGELKRALGVSEGQHINERLSQLFLKPLGFKTFQEAVSAMSEMKRQTSLRSFDLVHKSQLDHEPLTVKKGDFIKGLMNISYLPSILQNGSVAKEFLGSAADQDGTPLDTDIARVTQEGEMPFGQALSGSMAQNYGNVYAVFRDRGQYQETETDKSDKYNPTKYEIFSSSGNVNDQHYGARTGIPSTEIDFLAVNTGAVSEAEREDLYIEIAQNGFYIPVTDTEGKIIFSTQDYQDYRKHFTALKRFGEGGYAIKFSVSTDGNYETISKLSEELKASREATAIVGNEVEGAIEGVLQDLSIGLRSKDKLDSSTEGAELFNIGSTGRGTNMPGDYDFDMTLRLDDKDFAKVDSIISSLRATMSPEEDNSVIGTNGRYHQIRFKGAQIGDTKVDLDIGVTTKSEIRTFATQEAIEEKLSYIKEGFGEEAHDLTIANIVLAKQVLKEAHAYKKFEDGGFGGIGVEGWILLNGGNMEHAFKTFWEAAHENGQVIPLEKFVAKYKIIDPGINLRNLRHDNFTANLKPEGYQKMVEAIGQYLGLSE